MARFLADSDAFDQALNLSASAVIQPAQLRKKDLLLLLIQLDLLAVRESKAVAAPAFLEGRE